MSKTLFQKFYSFLGFGTYNLTQPVDSQGNYKTYKVIYWCCFPWRFYRKYDILKFKVKTGNFRKEM